MLGERYIGAFIQNTLKPLIEETDKLLGKCQNLNIDTNHLIDKLLHFELQKTCIKCLTYIVLGGILWSAVYTILHL